MLRLLLFQLMKYSESVVRRVPARPRPGSPVPGRSTLTTSAPSQARAWVQDVPASYCVRSRMRRPSSAGMVGLLAVRCGRNDNPLYVAGWRTGDRLRRHQQEGSSDAGRKAVRPLAWDGGAHGSWTWVGLAVRSSGHEHHGRVAGFRRRPRQHEVLGARPDRPVELPGSSGRLGVGIPVDCRRRCEPGGEAGPVQAGPDHAGRRALRRHGSRSGRGHRRRHRRNAVDVRPRVLARRPAGEHRLPAPRRRRLAGFGRTGWPQSRRNADLPAHPRPATDRDRRPDRGAHRRLRDRRPGRPAG